MSRPDSDGAARASSARVSERRVRATRGRAVVPGRVVGAHGDEVPAAACAAGAASASSKPPSGTDRRRSLPSTQTSDARDAGVVRGDARAPPRGGAAARRRPGERICTVGRAPSDGVGVVVVAGGGGLPAGTARRRAGRAGGLWLGGRLLLRRGHRRGDRRRASRCRRRRRRRPGRSRSSPAADGGVRQPVPDMVVESARRRGTRGSRPRRRCRSPPASSATRGRPRGSAVNGVGRARRRSCPAAPRLEHVHGRAAAAGGIHV